MGNVMKENKENKPKLLIWDMFNLTIGVNSVANIINKDTEQIGMYLGTLNVIRTVTERLKPERIFCCYDGPEAGARRRGLYKDYKDKRRVKSRLSVLKLYEDNNKVTEYLQKGAFEDQLGKIYEFSKLLPIQTFIVPGCEADDVIAYSALKYKDDYDVYIVSRDKDYLQLVAEGIKVYNWSSKKLYDQDSFKEQFGIRPDNYIFMKIFLGDTSDKISGVKGIGKKTLEVLYPFLNERQYENVDDLLDSLEKLNLMQFETRVRNAIIKLKDNEMKKKMRLAFLLMKLDKDCLKLHHLGIFMKQIEDQKDSKYQYLNARIKAQKDEFNKLYPGFNIENWLSPFNFVNRKKTEL